MGYHKKYIYRKKHPVLIRSNIIHTYLDQSQSRYLVKCHSRNTDQCIFGNYQSSYLRKCGAVGENFEGCFVGLGFILTFLTVCVSFPQTQYLIADHHEIATKSAQEKIQQHFWRRKEFERCKSVF